MVRQYEDNAVQQAHDRVFEQSRVVQKLKTIVGDDQVFTEDSLLHFSDPFSPDPKNFPSAAACPNTVEEIRDILAAANELHLPLWVASRGKNLGSAKIFSPMILCID
ncbi:MAG: hypothetical protein Q9195_006610 [Heterodermia aff. obscurata]